MHLSLAEEKQSTYASAFAELMRDRSSKEPAWLRLLRQKSFADFERLGLPTVSEEDWKYTNVAPIARTTFEPIWTEPEVRFNASDFAPFIYDETRNHTLVFVDGIFRPEDLIHGAESQEFLLMSFAEALARSGYESAIRQHYERNSGDGETGFTHLNTAFADGVLIVIPASVKIGPLHLLFIVNHEGPETPALFPRVLVLAEQNSAATIVETYVSSKNQKHLTNAFADVVLESGAHLQHYKLQRESVEAFHVATTRIDVGEAATYEATTINLGAALSRSNIEVTMDYPGASCAVDGLYMISGNQHSDTHSVIDHRAPHCTSRQLYKGVLDGKSHAVFNGKVFVRHGAQQTNAQQTNKNLLLSDEARIDTKPQLEIFADDVKCAHGAAVGQLSEDELFYLESRGIKPALARNILTYGFAEEVIEKIRIDSIKRELNSVVLNRLHSGLQIG
jgi:Fe-S cluster assembly protein SufD